MFSSQKLILTTISWRLEKSRYANDNWFVCSATQSFPTHIFLSQKQETIR